MCARTWVLYVREKLCCDNNNNNFQTVPSCAVRDLIEISNLNYINRQ